MKCLLRRYSVCFSKSADSSLSSHPEVSRLLRSDGCTPVRSVGHLSEPVGGRNTSCPSFVTRLNHSLCVSDADSCFFFWTEPDLDAVAACCPLVSPCVLEDDFESWLLAPPLHSVALGTHPLRVQRLCSSLSGCRTVYPHSHLDLAILKGECLTSQARPSRHLLFRLSLSEFCPDADAGCMLVP